MPMYEYRCDKCGSRYEVLHIGPEKIEDVVCPDCRSSEHHKLMSAPNMSMTGSSGSSGDPAPSCNGGCCGGSCGLD